MCNLHQLLGLSINQLIKLTRKTNRISVFLLNNIQKGAELTTALHQDHLNQPSLI